MADQKFEYVLLDAEVRRSADLESRAYRDEPGDPLAVGVRCGDCGKAWSYRPQRAGLGYAPVSCPGCGRSEPYAGPA
jgi:hypothetical protein